MDQGYLNASYLRHVGYALLSICLADLVELTNGQDWCPHSFGHLRMLQHSSPKRCPVACCGDVSHYYCCDDVTKQVAVKTTSVLESTVLCVLLVCFLSMLFVSVFVCCTTCRKQDKKQPRRQPSTSVTSLTDVAVSSHLPSENHLQVPTPDIFVLSNGIYQPPAYSRSPPPVYREKYLRSPPPMYKQTNSPTPPRRGSWSEGKEEHTRRKTTQKVRRSSCH